MVKFKMGSEPWLTPGRQPKCSMYLVVSVISEDVLSSDEMNELEAELDRTIGYRGFGGVPRVMGEPNQIRRNSVISGEAFARDGVETIASWEMKRREINKNDIPNATTVLKELDFLVGDNTTPEVVVYCGKPSKGDLYPTSRSDEGFSSSREEVDDEAYWDHFYNGDDDENEWRDG